MRRRVYVRVRCKNCRKYLERSIIFSYENIVEYIDCIVLERCYKCRGAR